VITTSRNLGAWRNSSETASIGFGAREASKIRMSALNFLAADKACDNVSALSTTRIIVFQGNNLAQPGAKDSLRVRTMTRTNAPRLHLIGCSMLSSVLTGMLAISSLPSA